jgi:outer membrane protein OmpA-like peptidoglycan-associated protein
MFGGKTDRYGTPSDAQYFDSHKTYYPVNGNEKAVRTIDAGEERTRRVFDRIGRQARTYKSQLQWGRPDFVVTPITFGQGQFALDEPAKQFLAKFTTDLQESTTDKIRLYVVGLASEEKNERQQLMLSVKRADAAADFIRGNLPAGNQWAVYSWGAGSGGDWLEHDSTASGLAPIFIGVVRGNQASD